MNRSLAPCLEKLRSDFDRYTETSTPLWHPLGFVSCVVDGMLQNLTVRLHYWPLGERRVKNPDWPIHTHIYDLTSLVLVGHVQDLQYQEVQGNRYTIYEVNYRGEDSEIAMTQRRTDIKVVVDEVRGKNQTYSVPEGIFHQTVVPLTESAVTLVALTNHVAKHPQVLGEPGLCAYPYDRLRFDAEGFWTVIRRVLNDTSQETPFR